MALEMMDKFRCVALCQRELYVFDLNTGELLSKLKGADIFLSKISHPSSIFT